MNVDVLIVGQGICGTFLSWNLMRQGKKVLVIDDAKPVTSSKIASGVINPVTGRRIVRTWMIEDLLSFAAQKYKELENELNVPLMQQCNVLDFHSTAQMKEAFEKRLAEGETYLKSHDESKWKPYLNFIYGVGEVDPCLLIDLNLLIGAWRDQLKQSNSLLEQKFDLQQLKVEADKITYQNIAAEKIIFCDGIASYTNPYFNLLPFAPNKGEALIVHIPGLPRTNILKQGLSIVPWKDDDLFWVGSSYQWTFENDRPTEGFKVKTQQALKFWLKLPFTIVEHLAAVRPATIERKPFVGFHPLHSNVGIFNGMGTKGCSLSPYFAHHLTENIINGSPISPEADVQRFKRILSTQQQ
jgi:glycine/D-amino acid oxidase-like deaminating enzyme